MLLTCVESFFATTLISSGIGTVYLVIAMLVVGSPSDQQYAALAVAVAWCSLSVVILSVLRFVRKRGK